MNAIYDLEQRIADYYETEAPSKAPDWLLTRAVDTIETTPQRRPWFGWSRRVPPMMPVVKLAIGGAAAVVLATAVALGSFDDRPAVGGPPTLSRLTGGFGDWTRSSIEPPHLHAVTAGGPGLVAVGARDANDDQADIWTSTDGRTWRRVPAEELGPGVINDVTTGGPGLVAVGWGWRGVVWTSRDGLTWSRAPDDPVFGGARIAAVSAGGPGLVAVGAWNRAWFSSDGLTWDRAEVPPVPPDVYPGDNGETPQVNMADVAAVGDRLVAVGSMMMNDSSDVAVVWTSADGKIWTDVPLEPEVFARGSSVREVTGGPDGFIAIGDIGDAAAGGRAAMWSSPDGRRWSRIGSDNDPFRSTQPEPDDDGVFVSSVMAGIDGYVAAGAVGPCNGVGNCSQTEAAVWTSRDGRSWVRVPTSPAFLASDPSPSEATGASHVVPLGSGFVVLGEYEGAGAVWIHEPLSD